MKMSDHPKWRGGSRPLRERNREIIEAVMAGESIEEVGRKFGIARQRISQIVRRDLELPVGTRINAIRLRPAKRCPVCHATFRGLYAEHCREIGHSPTGRADKTYEIHSAIVAEYKAGATLTDLAAKHYYTKNYIWRVCANRGVRRRGPILEPALQDARDAEILAAWEGGVTLIELGKAYGLSMAGAELAKNRASHDREFGPHRHHVSFDKR